MEKLPAPVHARSVSTGGVARLRPVADGVGVGVEIQDVGDTVEIGVTWCVAGAELSPVADAVAVGVGVVRVQPEDPLDDVEQPVAVPVRVARAGERVGRRRIVPAVGLGRRGDEESKRDQGQEGRLLHGKPIIGPL